VRGLAYVKEALDPLYGYIYLTELEVALIDTPLFQRLDRLLQNFSAHYAYPNATHTRKAHALGVMHLAHRALAKLLFRLEATSAKSLLYIPTTLERGERPRREDYEVRGFDWWNERLDEGRYSDLLQAMRVAALLHDVGHAPLSHVFEDACAEADLEFDHERKSLELISELGERIEAKLSGRYGEILEGARELFSLVIDASHESYVKELLSGPMDVDKIDYLNRDGYHSGALEYGLIDHERILDSFYVKEGRLVFLRPNLASVLRAFASAEQMYRNVFYHKTSRNVDLMCVEMLKRRRELMQELLEAEEPFAGYGDYELLWEVARDEGKDRKASELARRLLSRQLYFKLLFQASVPRDRFTPELKQRLAALEDEYEGLEARIDHVEARPIRQEYGSLSAWLRAPRVYDPDAKRLLSLEEAQPLLSELATRFSVDIRVFVARGKEKEKRAEQLVRRVSALLSPGR
jgi:HD superfamily phosphohydrolase